MNDELYRQAKDSIKLPQCLYEKALQGKYFGCQHSHRMALGERESIRCLAQKSHDLCQQYLLLSTRYSGFALGKTSLPTHLPFNQAMKVQIGSMIGARFIAALSQENKFELADISHILSALYDEQTQFESLDFSQIVPHITKFSARQRKKKA